MPPVPPLVPTPMIDNCLQVCCSTKPAYCCVVCDINFICTHCNICAALKLRISYIIVSMLVSTLITSFYVA